MTECAVFGIIAARSTIAQLSGTVKQPAAAAQVIEEPAPAATSSVITLDQLKHNNGENGAPLWAAIHGQVPVCLSAAALLMQCAVALLMQCAVALLMPCAVALLMQFAAALLMRCVQVYDLTEFADEHPAGPEPIFKAAGTDATEMFDEVSAVSHALAALDFWCHADSLHRNAR